MHVEAGPTLKTDRLVLRRWRPEDLEPFAALNADPEVMEFFPARYDRVSSDGLVAKTEQSFEERGYGLWAVERLGDRQFLGFVGLSYLPPGDLPFGEAVEVGWRLARFAWGHGYATEAALNCLQFGFEQVGLSEVVSMTSELNVRSQKVMRSIGLQRDQHGDFEHPRVPAGSGLRPHVLYRMSSAGWTEHKHQTREL